MRKKLPWTDSIVGFSLRQMNRWIGTPATRLNLIKRVEITANDEFWTDGKLLVFEPKPKALPAALRVLEPNMSVIQAVIDAHTVQVWPVNVTIYRDEYEQRDSLRIVTFSDGTQHLYLDGGLVRLVLGNVPKGAEPTYWLNPHTDNYVGSILIRAGKDLGIIARMKLVYEEDPDKPVATYAWTGPLAVQLGLPMMEAVNAPD